MFDKISVESIPNIRVCTLRRKPDFNGWGLTIRNSQTRPNQVASVEANSPAQEVGILVDDLIMKVNEVSVVAETSLNIISMIEKEFELGVIKLTVIEPHQCSSTLLESFASYRTPTDDSSNSDNRLDDITLPPPPRIQYQDNAAVAAVAADTHNDSAPQIFIQPVELKESPLLLDSRVCNLISRDDYRGYGFSTRASESGPHQIKSVEADSPADDAGLRVNDFILKVNDIEVVGERYSKLVTILANESERGRIKLEVIEPEKCPQKIRNTIILDNESRIDNQPTGGLENLRKICSEVSKHNAIIAALISEDKNIEKSYLVRPSFLDRPSTVDSHRSIFLTEPPEIKIQPKPQPQENKRRFKKCTIKFKPGYDRNSGFGLTINSKIKPKFMILVVDADSPAFNANLRTGDVIVAIDGTNIRKLDFDKVRGMLQNALNQGKIEVLAISLEGYTHYKSSQRLFNYLDWTKLATNNVDVYSN